MALLLIVLMLILIQYTYFGFKVGGARMKYSIKAPATSGHPEFERYYRVHQNTLENIIILLPALTAFVLVAERIGWPGYEIGSALGVVWLIGRGVYARSYVKDPDTRGKGFMLGFVATSLLILGTLAAAVIALVSG